MKHIKVLLLAITTTLLLSCTSTKLTQDRIEEEFEMVVQSERAKADVYRVALIQCKEN